MISILRVIRFALQDIVRNFSLSFMTVLILVLMLLSINTMLTMRLLTSEATTAVKKQIDMSVFFKVEAKAEQVEEVIKFVKSLPEVSSSTFYSRDQVLARFKEQKKDNKEVLTALDELGDNPFGATLVIQAKEPKDYEKIIKSVEIPAYEEVIEAKTFANVEKAVDRIHLIITQVEQFSLILTALFAFISFIIIFNTIRVAIYTQRIEISIKKLVGASNWFVRGPYVVEALVFSLLSAGLTFFAVFFATKFLDPYIAQVLNTSSFLTNYFFSNILLLFSMEFVGVFILTMLSSSLAMRKYLKV